MKITKERLQEKGWSEEEIEKTMKILHHAKSNPHPHIHKLNKAVYWIAFSLTIIGNIAFSLFLLPLLLTTSGLTLFFIILVVAFSFGVLMSVIIKDLEDLQRHHHLAMFLSIPIVGIINFVVIVAMANKITALANAKVAGEFFTMHQNPYIIGLIYLVGFLIPYIYLVFEERWK